MAEAGKKAEPKAEAPKPKTDEEGFVERWNLMLTHLQMVRTLWGELAMEWPRLKKDKVPLALQRVYASPGMRAAFEKGLPIFVENLHKQEPKSKRI